ncbi:MAG: type II 3-dehydroquinate dehydratase [Myxococcota bacterium]|nr:type II 3-dehydroquinate dehydratase [Myxococcota bacterium]
MKIAVIHGPNLNLLGSREPEVYGSTTLDEVNAGLHELAHELGVSVSVFQSNHEGVLIDHIHGLVGDCDGIVINPGGLTHTSVSLRDALVGVGIGFVETHLSNVYARESFRHQSYLSGVALGVVSGFGVNSYRLALRALVDQLS